MRVHPAGKLGEGATAVTGAELYELLFQSTPPARGGDGWNTRKFSGLSGFQSTPPARGATKLRRGLLYPAGFQSTPPREGGDVALIENSGLHETISIHAPREGGDGSSANYYQPTTYFNPRPREGGDHTHQQKPSSRNRFQSTPPARGATYMGGIFYVT